MHRLKQNKIIFKCLKRDQVREQKLLLLIDWMSELNHQFKEHKERLVSPTTTLKGSKLIEIPGNNIMKIKQLHHLQLHSHIKHAEKPLICKNSN